MKKLLLIFLLLILFTAIFFISENRKLRVELSNQKGENEALNNYIKALQDKIAFYEEGEREAVEIPKSQTIRELLDSYLKEQGSKEKQFEPTISMEELRSDLQDYQLQQRFIPNLIPVAGEYVISQYFSEKHKAVDLAAASGTEVVATAAGVIKSVYEDKYFGNVIVIDHLNHHLTFYAHLAKIFYQQGYFVEKGQVIALVGSSGFSRNPHLHYEVIYRGENQNPLDIMNIK